MNHVTFKEENDSNCEEPLEEDEDDLDDVDEDDIYVADGYGRESFKPLMFPRQLSKSTPSSRNRRRRRARIGITCLIFLTVVACVLLIVFLLVHNKQTNQNYDGSKTSNVEIIGCSNVSFRQSWAVGIPKLITESAIRMVDVNGDSTLDVVIGFATGAEGYNVIDIVCDIYFNGTKPCYGGVMALDGKTGSEIWRTYTKHEVYALSCGVNLDGDDVYDCICAGRAGVLLAVSGRDGHPMWTVTPEAGIQGYMNFYTPAIVPDLDGDGVSDLIMIHGGDPLAEPNSKTRLAGKIQLLSGQTGEILRWLVVPDRRESYYSPQVYIQADATPIVVFGTGGETHGGGLWVISLMNLYHGHINQAKRLIWNDKKGFMAPAVLVDVNDDDVCDIVIAGFGSSVYAIDGQTFNIIWTYRMPQSETYSTIAPGHYNDDDKVDFMIQYSTGPGFPVYYYTQTTILDGKSGKPILKPFLKNAVGIQSSPLSIAFSGRGNDLFLFWDAGCKDVNGTFSAFAFVKGTNVHEKSRSDICRLRFKSKGFSRYNVLGRNLPNPVTLYHSDDYRTFESSKWINTTAEGINFVKNHPEHLEDYRRYSLRAVIKDEQLSGSTKRRRPDLNKSRINNGGGYRMCGPMGCTKGGPRSQSYSPRSYSRQRPWYQSQYYNKENIPLGINKKWPSNRRPYINDVPKKWKINQVMMSRRKRHVGPHDEGGLQRLISTGTLAPSSLDEGHPDYERSVDVIYATYWFYPAHTRLTVSSVNACIEQKFIKAKKKMSDKKYKYFGLNDDKLRERLRIECESDEDEDRVYESQSTFNPYNIHMGQLSIYRTTLICSCPNLQPNQKCGRFAPYSAQPWGAYLGTQANSYYIPWNPS